MSDSLIQLPGITTSEAPTPRLSKADIAAPYAELAHNMDRMGEAATEVATNLAEQAGRKAVRTDDAGNLVVDTAPIIGPASQAYARAARMTVLAKLEPQIGDKLTEMRLEHPNDPQGFKDAAGAFLKEKTGQFANDPALAGAVEKAGAEAASHNYRTSLIETNRNQIAESLQAYQARIRDINEQTATLARQGGTGTPEYLSRAADRAALWNELQSDPRFKFSKERADLEIQEAYSHDVVQSVIGNVQRTYQDKRNIAATQKTLQDAFWGPGSERLKLTATQRDRGITEGLHALANISAQDREAISENKQAVSGYISNLLRDPAMFDEGQHNDMVHRAEEIGDYRSLADLQTTKSFVPLWDTLKRMPPEQAAVTLGQMSRGIVPGTAPPPSDKMIALGQQSREFFGERGHGRFEGLNPEFAGRLRTAIEAAEQATGEKAQIESLYRTHEEQAAAYARYQRGEISLAAAPGHSRHEQGDAADIANGKALQWLHQHAGEFGLEFLPGHSGQIDPGHIQMAGGLVPGQHVDIFADNATARLWQSTLRDYRTRVAGIAERLGTGIEDKIRHNDGLAPDELSTFITAAVQSGRSDLIDKVQPSLKALDVIQQLPEGASSTAVAAQIEQLKAAGVNNVDYNALNMAQHIVEESAKAMRSEPLIEGSRKRWFPPIGALDPQKPQAFVGEIQDREKKTGLVQQHDPGHGAINVIAPEEGRRIATTLTQGDPKQASEILGAIGTLSPENYQATMFGEPIRNAVVSMSASTDPARMSAAMTAMDTLYRRNPSAFKAAYGESASTRLLAWQALQGQFNAVEIAERINKVEDPSMAEARRKIGEAADKELKTDPQGVANQLGSWMDRNIPLANARPPADALQAGAMAAQFTDTYKALRTYGVDPDKAKEQAVKRLSETWSQSDVAGGQFMQHAPERVTNPRTGRPYYPAIDGSRQWMSDQLTAFLDKLYGKSTSVQAQAAGTAAGLKPSTMAAAGQPTSNWRLRGLIPDSQTQGEISTGKPPTYQIAVERNGQIEMVHGPDGMPARYRWDYDTALKAAMPGMIEATRRARERQDALDPAKNAGMPQP